MELDTKKVGEYTVFPVGLKHFKKFTKTLSTVAMAVAKAPGLKLDVNSKMDISSLAQALMPIVITDMMDIVLDCCTPRPPEDLPHWLIPDLALAWLEVSFLDDTEKKLRPWVQAVETLIQRLVGKPFSIWDSLSKLSSPAATPAGTSSANTNQDGRTPDGPFLSSGTGQDAHSSSSIAGT